jgi:hypothetical protein
MPISSIDEQSFAFKCAQIRPNLSCFVCVRTFSIICFQRRSAQSAILGIIWPQHGDADLFLLDGTSSGNDFNIKFSNHSETRAYFCRYFNPHDDLLFTSNPW